MTWGLLQSQSPGLNVSRFLARGPFQFASSLVKRMTSSSLDSFHFKSFLWDVTVFSFSEAGSSGPLPSGHFPAQCCAAAIRITPLSVEQGLCSSEPFPCRGEGFPRPENWYLTCCHLTCGQVLWGIGRKKCPIVLSPNYCRDSKAVEVS